MDGIVVDTFPLAASIWGWVRKMLRSSNAPAHIGGPQIRPQEIGPAQVRVPQVSADQVGAPRARARGSLRPATSLR